MRAALWPLTVQEAFELLHRERPYLLRRPEGNVMEVPIVVNENKFDSLLPFGVKGRGIIWGRRVRLRASAQVHWGTWGDGHVSHCGTVFEAVEVMVLYVFGLSLV